MTYRDELRTTFTETLTGVIPEIKEKDIFPSEPFLYSLAKVLDIAFSLDTMKNFKGSMTNDLSAYKRYALLIIEPRVF
jgi:hypothetical protein